MPEITMPPPVAREELTRNELHGTSLEDRYGWMRDKSSPEVIEHLRAENAYTEAMLADTTELQERLYREMLSHIKETDESVPYPYRGWMYSTRTEEGRQYAIHCRRKAAGAEGEAEGAEAVMLDVNELAVGQAFMAVGMMSVSPDGNLLAYSTDNTGFRQYTLHVRDLRTGQELPDTAERVGSMAWSSDGAMLLYTTEDEVTKRHDKLWRHRLGGGASDDVLVYEERDERFNLGVGKSRDGLFLLMEAGSHTTNEYRWLRADEPEGEFQVIAPRVDDQEYYVDHRDGLFYLRVNDTGRNFRLVTVPVNVGSRDGWKELLAEDAGAPLEEVDLFEKFLVCSRRREGLTTLEVHRFGEGGALEEGREIRFPEPAYTAQTHVNREFGTGVFRYSYQSLVSPASVYEYDIRTGESKLLKQQEIPGGFDAANYASERVWVVAEDGVRVPVSLVYRRDRFGKDWDLAVVCVWLRVVRVPAADRVQPGAAGAARPRRGDGVCAHSRWWRDGRSVA